MPLANPARQFANVRFNTRPYERRSVCVMPASTQQDHRNDPRNWVPGQVSACSGGNHTHFSRSRVVELVERGEMRWLDKFHNQATYTALAGGTWQKTASGGVHTMQLVQGMRGRHVPFAQREPELEVA